MRRIALILAALAVALPQLALASHPAGPDPHHDSLVDGCQRSQAMVLTLSTPEWVYVHRDQVLAGRLAMDALAGRRVAEGIVGDIHPAGDDLFYNHDVGDVDIDLDLEPAYWGLSPVGDHDIGMEWEDALIPMWAWPQVGDRVRASGSWIWDCGHWGDGVVGPGQAGTISALLPYDPYETAQDLEMTGTIRGESTEIHPLQEVATFRANAAGLLQGTPRRLARLDSWISGDGGWALAEEECALLGLPSASNHACSRYRDVGGPYEYRVPLPAKPTGSSTLLLNPVVVHAESSVNPPVTTSYDSATNELVVSFALPHNWIAPNQPAALSAVKFGITVEAGWDDDATPVTHHVVTFNSVHIQKSLDGLQQMGGSEPNQNPVANGPEFLDLEPGEWVMVAHANGHWVQLFPLSGVSGLVTADETKPLGGITIDYYLPSSAAPRLYVSARECDIPTIDCPNDYYGGTPTLLHPELGYNDHPGRVNSGGHANIGRLMTGGTAVYAPVPNPNTTNPSAGNEYESDYTCGPNACYQLTATLTSTPA